MGRETAHTAPQPPPLVDDPRRAFRWGARQFAVLSLLVLVTITSPFAWDFGYRERQFGRAREELRRLEISTSRDRLAWLAERYPRNGEILFWLGRAERRNGKLVDAMEHFERAREAGVEGVRIDRQIRLMEAQAGRVFDTDSFVREFSSLNDDLISEEVYEALAHGFMFTHRSTDALACLSYWIEWRSDRVQPRLYRAEVLERIDRWPMAIEEYETILKFAPEHNETRRKYARTLLKYGDAQIALAQYRDLLERHSDDPELLLGLGKCWDKIGEPARAAEFYRQLLTRETDDETRLEALVGLGKSELFFGRPELACEHLSRAIAINPQHHEAHFQLAAAYAQLNQPDRAAQHRERFRELNQAQIRFKKILDLLTDDSRNADLRFEAGELLEQLETSEQAIAWWNASASIVPGHGPTHRRLEAHYRRVGNSDRAEEHRRIAERAEESQSTADGKD